MTDTTSLDIILGFIAGGAISTIVNPIIDQPMRSFLSRFRLFKITHKIENDQDKEILLTLKNIEKLLEQRGEKGLKVSLDKNRKIEVAYAR